MDKNGAFFWKIEKVISKGDYNYAVVKEHPNATKHGYVLEHRIVMENHLGRFLNSNSGSNRRSAGCYIGEHPI